MAHLDSEKPRSKRPLVLTLVVIVAVALVAGGFTLAPRFERKAPVVTVTPEPDVVGATPIEVGIADAGAGLKSISVTVSAGGKDYPIAADNYTAPPREHKVSIAVAKLAGIKEGEAVLRVRAKDASLWRWFGGNETTVEKKFTIDVTPPTLQLVAEDRYINFGGAGALVYKPAADTVTSGVRVGQHFFPGIKGPAKGQPDHYVVLFAHPYNAPANAKVTLVATDKAGNTREMGISYELKGVKYRKSTLPISESFLQNKVAPLLTGSDAKASDPKETFLAVNNRLRKQNDDKITAITKKATPEVQWQGAFVQLSNSKVEANFADERTYTWNGQPIDKAFHLGYDLSVTKQYPVEAANSGTVAFAGDLGIYGNTVILDHGLGLFTLYSHLSAVDVKEGDKVEQKKILGRTGETGLAGGDHLHYGVYLHGVAVLPVEWWDPKWIADNIQPKLDGMSGAAIDQMQRPARAATRKRR